MTRPYVFSSLTRIAPFAEDRFAVTPLPKREWATSDYVVCEVLSVKGQRKVELTSGRMREVAPGDVLIGALGARHATLEATGTWQAAGEDGRLHVLTSAGLIGKCTSRSPYIPALMPVQYLGHVHLEDEKATMRRFVEAAERRAFDIPVLLIVGTSMSAGKTTAARILVRYLKAQGQQVVGAKLAGAGRLKDIQSMADAGADWVFDFVDAGLPSTVLPEKSYRPALEDLLARLAGTAADVAVVEIGSSPLEPYNGDVAIEAIRPHLQATVLCASDPYAAYGVMHAFDLQPTFVTGVAVNTRAGVELTEKLCDVRAINLMDPEALPLMERLLAEKLALSAAPE